MIICSLEIDNYKQYAGHHLIELAQSSVQEKFGVALEREVRIIGEAK